MMLAATYRLATAPLPAQPTAPALLHVPVTPLDPLGLRRALGSFGTGVTVVSTLAENGKLVGLTVNSFNSVSLDPAIVLWSLNRHSSSLAAFDHNGRFVVNVLAVDQADLSQRFSKPTPHAQANKFVGVAHSFTPQGLPVLTGCAAHFECSVAQRLEVGDHVLFLGQVEAFEHHRRIGLLYCQGRYAQGVHIDV
jgi:flavin reductase (DIM6/NTAB) family NADH-FMN oxidoreductase RutF